MRKLPFILYHFTERLKRRLRLRTTLLGRYLLVLTLLCTVFGLNTYATMLYQMASFLAAVIIISFPFSLRFSPELIISRRLPKSCTAGEEFSYGIKIKSTGKQQIKGISYQECPPTALPTYEEFSRTAETGEESRNIVDRVLKYYRWSWLVRKKQRVVTPHLSLADIPAGAEIEMETTLTAKRRGQLHLEGYSLWRDDPLGVFKKTISIAAEKNILVLPKTYPISDLSFAGSRKYHQGGLISGAQFGDSQEFIALREYQPGDSIRHMDWKATARAQKPILRQYQDEYFTRYGIILDGFTQLESCLLFEEAISIGASIILKNVNTDHVVDLLFAGNTIVSNATMGRGLADPSHLLEILACLQTCQDRSFSELTDLVKHNIHLLSGTILIFIDLDSKRKKLLTFLQETGIPFQAVLITHDMEQSKKLMESLGQLPPITLVPLDRETEEVRLA